MIKGYWTKERCLEEALKYENKKDFRENSKAFSASKKKGWLNEICNHMIEVKKPNGYWTKEKCLEEALKFKTKKEFSKFTSCYSASKKKGWLNEICNHMIEVKKPNGYWTKEKCLEEALKFKTKTEFIHNSKSAYSSALKNLWLDSICKHMPKIGSLYNRCIYVYEFLDNSVYVGLTLNLDRRNEQHFKNEQSSVFQHIKKTKLIPKLIKISKYININKAINLEKNTIEKYKRNGWKLLNKVKGGSLGATNRYWTKEKCIEEGFKYNSKKEFREKSYSSYKISLRNNWLEEVTKHMNQTIKPKGYWTKEKCIEEGSKFNSKKEFREKSPICYKISLRNNWLEVTSHMNILVKPKGYWTKEKCQEESSKYKSKKEFIKNSYNCYKISYRNNWLEDITKHFVNNN